MNNHEQIAMKNVLVLLGLMAVSIIYLAIAASRLDPAVSYVVVPVLLGIAGCLLLKGSLLLRLVMLALIPVAQVVILGGDPAKPGLERLIAVLEMVPLVLGALGCYVATSHMSPVKKYVLVAALIGLVILFEMVVIPSH